MSYSNAGKSEEAVRCFRKAIELLAKANNRQHLAFANANLAYEYLKLNKTGDALPYLKKAINYAVEINDKLALSDAYKTAGIYYRKTNDMASSLNYLKKAEMYARDIQNMTFLKDIYNELSICYESGGDPKNALYYLQQKNAVTDTIQKQNSRKAYIEMMVKYETVRTKEEADEAKKNISALREESEKKSFLFWGVLISVFIAAAVPLLAYKKKLAAFFHFYNNMSRRRFKDKRSEKSAVSVIGGVNPGNTPADPPAINMLAQSLKKLMDGEKKYLESELTLNETARILNTNTAYLSRVINEQNGMNFNNYINSYRIEEAKRLMDEGKQDSMTFEGIGKSCGFISRSAFNQAFKKFTGLTPTEYISKKNKENK